MNLLCAVCLWTPLINSSSSEAITIAGGMAVCEEHLGYAQDDRVTRAIILIKEKQNGEH